MHSNTFYTSCFLIIFVCGSASALDKRIQDANLDFLSFEGHKKPAPSVNPPNSRFNAKLDPPTTSTTTAKATSTSTTTTSKPTTQKPTTPLTPVRQLIKNFNDKISDNERQVPQVPKPTRQGPGSSLSSTQQNKNFNAGPMLSSSQQPNPAGFPKSTGTTISTSSSVTPKPNPTSPLSPGGRNDFPGLPKSGGVVSPTPPPKQASWSSVVAGNSKPGGPGIISNPSNIPRTAQDLRPITIGENFPSIQQSTPASATTKNEIASDKELKDVSEALLNKDTNNAAKYITVNYQGKTTFFSKEDVAPQPLLTVQADAWNIPTISAMKTLLDNYEPDVTVNEYVTPQEKNEENAFLDAVMATSVMRHLMSFLKDKGLVTPDPKQQRDLLKQIWFNMYSRGQGKIGSSGFEHIFLSELKNGEISGLHNWIYFYTEETANRLNYLGFLKKVELPNKGAILKLHFTMKGVDKPVDTLFVGTSPELEMALYSLCYMTRVDRDCPLSLAGQNFNLRTHNYRYRSKNMIGSAFPEI